MFHPAQKHDDADKHPDACCRKCSAPADIPAQPGRKKIADQRPDIDSHVKNIVPGVFQYFVTFVIVQISQQNGDIGFKKSISQYHHPKRGVKGKNVVWNRQHEVADTHQNAPQDNAEPIAQ